MRTLRASRLFFVLALGKLLDELGPEGGQVVGGAAGYHAWLVKTSSPTHSPLALLMSACSGYLSGVWLYAPPSSPRSTSLAKFSSSSRISRSGFEITSAAISPTLPLGGSA
jgi:hypothetical protein